MPLPPLESRTRRRDRLIDKSQVEAGRRTERKIRLQLGLTHASASRRLLREIVFRLLEEAGRSSCYRCHREMTSATWSIDHVRDWMDVDPSLFWDVDNVSFSHKRCNSSAARRGSGNPRINDQGEAWCSKGQHYLPLPEFRKRSQSSNGVEYWCRGCTKVANARRYLLRSKAS